MGFRSVRELEQAIATFLQVWNVRLTPFAWTAGVEKIREKFARCRLTGPTGGSLDLTPFHLILTSNLGGDEVMRMRHSSPSAVETANRRQVDHHLRPVGTGTN